MSIRTRRSSCKLIATVHGPGGDLPRSRAPRQRRQGCIAHFIAAPPHSAPRRTAAAPHRALTATVAAPRRRREPPAPLPRRFSPQPSPLRDSTRASRTAASPLRSLAAAVSAPRLDASLPHRCLGLPPQPPTAPTASPSRRRLPHGYLAIPPHRRHRPTAATAAATRRRRPRRYLAVPPPRGTTSARSACSPARRGRPAHPPRRQPTVRSPERRPLSGRQTAAAPSEGAVSRRPSWRGPTPRRG